MRLKDRDSLFQTLGDQQAQRPLQGKSYRTSLFDISLSNWKVGVVGVKKLDCAGDDVSEGLCMESEDLDGETFLVKEGERASYVELGTDF